MNKVFLKLALMFLITKNVYAQDITININKNGTGFTETIDGKSKNTDGNYEIEKIKDFKIVIKKTFTGSYKIKLLNQAAPGGTPMNEMTVTDDSKIIVVDSDGKIAGEATNAISLAAKFRMLINNSLIITFVGNSIIDKKEVFKPTGIVFPDAKKLIDELKAPAANNTTILQILSYYTNLSETKKELKSWQQAKDFYKNNSFVLAYIIEAEKTIRDQVASNSDGSVNMLSSALSSIGGLDVTNIADGFAKFIVKRTKQELSISFFEKFRKELDKYDDLKTVFPQTYKALTAIDKDIYMYTAFLQGLREAFEKDLAALPDNLHTIIDNHEKFFEKFPELKAILQTGFYIAGQIENKQHPGNIIEDYPVEYLDDPSINSNIKASFEAFKLISKSLKSDTATDRYWATYTDIKKLFSGNDDRLLKIYLGLLEQQANLESITFKDISGTDHALWAIIETSFTTIANDLPMYKTYFKNLILKIESIETKIKGLKNIASDSLKFENYYSFVSSSIDLMKYFTEVEKLPRFPKRLDIQKKTGIYFYLAQTSADIVVDVNRRNYSSAVINIVQIYDTIFNKKHNKEFNDVAFAPSNPAVSGTELETEKKEFQLVKDQQNNAGEIARDIFKYGSFMAAIAMAKTSDDVEKAIEAVALPVGSARIKRTTPVNVAINAYAGLFYGHESISGVKDNLVLNSYGLTVPIGVTLSTGTKNGWSHSLLVSLVDIGAVAAFRFADDTTAQVPNIQLKHIFSPGVFYSLGIRNSPLSINLGVQAGPNLRKVTSTTNDFSDKTYIRYSISVCVDLPLLNLYTKSR